ncbi:MAG: hypothetical protein V1855_02985 [bacterium]
MNDNISGEILSTPQQINAMGMKMKDPQVQIEYFKRAHECCPKNEFFPVYNLMKLSCALKSKDFSCYVNEMLHRLTISGDNVSSTERDLSLVDEREARVTIYLVKTLSIIARATQTEFISRENFDDFLEQAYFAATRRIPEEKMIICQELIASLGIISSLFGDKWPNEEWAVFVDFCLRTLRMEDEAYLQDDFLYHIKKVFLARMKKQSCRPLIVRPRLTYQDAMGREDADDDCFVKDFNHAKITLTFDEDGNFDGVVLPNCIGLETLQ